MDPDDRHAAVLNIEVVFCPAPGLTQTVQLQLPQGAVLGDAWRLSGLAAAAPEQAAAITGIWGRVQPPGTRLRDGDRVEIYRPLQVDPKEARRLRYKRHRQQR